MKVKNNLTFWNKYYKKNRITKESGFARSITKYFNKKLKLIDIGCGDGRDSFYFSKFLKSIVAADQSSIAIKNNKKINLTNIKFIKKNFAMKNFFLKKKFDLIYARFFLHTLNYVEEKNFFKNIKKISKKKQ